MPGQGPLPPVKQEEHPATAAHTSECAGGGLGFLSFLDDVVLVKSTRSSCGLTKIASHRRRVHTRASGGAGVERNSTSADGWSLLDAALGVGTIAGSTCLSRISSSFVSLDCGRQTAGVVWLGSAEDEDATGHANTSAAPAVGRTLAHCGTLSLRSCFYPTLSRLNDMAIRVGAFDLIMAALTPVALGMGGAAGGVTMASCPMPFGPAFGDIELPSLPDLSSKDLERGVLLATFVQGSLGLIRICSGDVFSGSYTLLLATLGYNARRPGPASNWLKTYVLITFINGTMGSIDLVQQALNQNFPTLLTSLPLSVNLLHLTSLLGPCASFLGAACGWQHIKVQKKMAAQAYHHQIEYLLQNPPWPPPPLHADIVKSMMQYSLAQIQQSGRLNEQGKLPTLLEGNEEDDATGPVEAAAQY